MKIIDLTHSFANTMPVFPGDASVRLKEMTDRKNAITHFRIETGMHVGTHMDGPLHMIPGGRKLSEIPIEKFVANGHVVDARGRSEISADLLDSVNLEKGDCVLVYTGFDEKFRTRSFYADYPDLTEEFAHKLVASQISFVGMDAPSPDKHPYPIHRILLQKEILIIECMNNLAELLLVERFEVMALPMKFEADSAPARVIARVPARIACTS